MPNLQSPTVDQLKRAVQIAEQIQSLEREIAAILGGETKGNESKGESSPVGNGRRKRRAMSPEARERIAQAQRNRWAKSKGSDGGGEGEAAADEGSKAEGKPRRKRTMSPEARAKIAEATRKRWAERKKTEPEA